MSILNEELANKLECEYKENLKSIRPYVLSLTDRKALVSCRVWIEKLDSQNKDNEKKKTRNCYMAELRRQLESGNLNAPFIYDPPKGSLKDIASNESDSWSDVTEYTTKTLETDYGEEETLPQGDSQNGNTKIEYNESFVDDLRKKNLMLKHALDKLLKETLEGRLQENKKLSTMLKQKDSEWSKKLNDLRINIIENYEDKIGKITKNKDLEWQEKLGEEVQNLVEDYEHKIQNLTDEKELEYEMKAHEIKLTLMEEIEERVKTAKEEKDKEWRNRLDQMQRAIQSEYDSKVEEHKNELEYLSRSKDIEMKDMQKMYEEQYNKMKEEYEKRSYLLHGNNEKELIRKISFLQQYVLKLEKLVKKYQIKYVEKTEALRRNLVIKENTMHMQLMTQNAQLLTQCRNENLYEMETTVEKLESKYKNLLEEQMKKIKECKYINNELTSSNITIS